MERLPEVTFTKNFAYCNLMDPVSEVGEGVEVSLGLLVEVAIIPDRPQRSVWLRDKMQRGDPSVGLVWADPLHNAELDELVPSLFGLDGFWTARKKAPRLSFARLFIFFCYDSV